MAVVIEELEVQAQAQPAAPPPTSSDGKGGASPEVEERALLTALMRDTWRLERLVAD